MPNVCNYECVDERPSNDWNRFLEKLQQKKNNVRKWMFWWLKSRRFMLRSHRIQFSELQFCVECLFLCFGRENRTKQSIRRRVNVFFFFSFLLLSLSTFFCFVYVHVELIFENIIKNVVVEDIRDAKSKQSKSVNGKVNANRNFNWLKFKRNNWPRPRSIKITQISAFLFFDGQIEFNCQSNRQARYETVKHFLRIFAHYWCPSTLVFWVRLKQCQADANALHYFVEMNVVVQIIMDCHWILLISNENITNCVRHSCCFLHLSRFRCACIENVWQKSMHENRLIMSLFSINSSVHGVFSGENKSFLARNELFFLRSFWHARQAFASSPFVLSIELIEWSATTWQHRRQFQDDNEFLLCAAHLRLNFFFSISNHLHSWLIQFRCHRYTKMNERVAMATEKLIIKFARTGLMWSAWFHFVFVLFAHRKMKRQQIISFWYFRAHLFQFDEYNIFARIFCIIIRMFFHFIHCEIAKNGHSGVESFIFVCEFIMKRRF